MLSGEPTTGVCRLLLTPVAIQTQHATIKRSLRPPPTLYCLPPSSHYIFVVPATNQLPAPKGDWQSACAQLQWRAAICPRFHISRIDQVRRACRQAPTSSTGFTYNEVSNEKNSTPCARTWCAVLPSPSVALGSAPHSSTICTAVLVQPLLAARNRNLFASSGMCLADWVSSCR